MAKAKPLSSEEIEAFCENLRQRDYRYAESLDTAQFNFLKSNPRIKNWQEFKTVEDMKRAIIGLHENKSVSIKDGDKTIEVKWQD